jgi:hypothetical protein
MEAILQSLLDMPGVSAALVFDGSGRLAGHRARSVYDRALCEQVSAALNKAVDSIQLQHEDWEAVTAQFADGKVLLRNLGTVAGRAHVLALVAEATLNPSFAAVAIRVASNKLRKALEGGPERTVAPAEAPPAASASAVVASTGTAWAKSSPGLSNLAVADPGAAAFLARCAKELARHVGPMAKIFVAEAVRRIATAGPFALSQRRALVEELTLQVEDPSARDALKRTLMKDEPQ